MQENGRLGHFGLPQIFIPARKHQVGDAKAQQFIGFLKHRTGRFRTLIQILAHPYKLGALAGKYKCFFHKLVDMFGYKNSSHKGSDFSKALNETTPSSSSGKACVYS